MFTNNLSILSLVESLFPVVWVQTFSPATPEILELVRMVTQADKTLKLSLCWKDAEQKEVFT